MITERSPYKKPLLKGTPVTGIRDNFHGSDEFPISEFHSYYVCWNAALKSPGLSGGKPQLLVDPKRATILDIFMSGLKNGGTRRLVDILSSVKEQDSFPAEKLATIRRYLASFPTCI